MFVQHCSFYAFAGHAAVHYSGAPFAIWLVHLSEGE